MEFSKRITKQQAKKRYLKFPNKPQQQKNRILLRKLIYRFRVSILKAKQLKEFKIKKELKVVTRFANKIQGNIIKQQLDDTL